MKSKTNTSNDMKTRITLTLCLLLAVVVTAADKPNVLFIISDDQAWGDYGFMGHPHIATPHLDRLAAQSLDVRARLHARAAVPAVAGQHRHRALSASARRHRQRSRRCRTRASTPWPRAATRNTRATTTPSSRTSRKQPNLVRDLTSRGYLALQTGKWWEGDPVKTAGFTHAMTQGEAKGGRHGDAGLDIGREGLEPIYRFIEQAGDKPWLVWYAPMLPHAPHTPPEDLLQKYLKRRPERTGRPLLGLRRVVRPHLRRTARLPRATGLRDNTIVIYTTDNGWIQDPDKANRFAPRSKLTPYEGGVRTPIMISWPGQVKPRLDKEHLASNVDLWPTLAALLKTPTPARLARHQPHRRAAPSPRAHASLASNTPTTSPTWITPTRSLQHRWIIEGGGSWSCPTRATFGMRNRNSINSNKTLGN